MAAGVALAVVHIVAAFAPCPGRTPLPSRASRAVLLPRLCAPAEGDEDPGARWYRTVAVRKAAEVDGLLRLPEARDDGPLQMRLRYMAPEQNYRFSDAIRRRAKAGKLGVCACVASPEPMAATAVRSAAREAVARGVDALLLSVDPADGCGSVEDLREVTNLLAGAGPNARRRGPPVVGSDLVVDPLQLARLAEAGADAAVVDAGLAGQELEALLNVCTALGIEALVKVHDLGELEWAIECGATAVIVSRRTPWDGAVDTSRGIALASAIPGHVLSLVQGGFLAPTREEIEDHLDAGFDGIVLDHPGDPTDARGGLAALELVRECARAQGAASWGSVRPVAPDAGGPTL